MMSSRFDSIVRKLTDDWEFEALLDFYRKNAIGNSRHLEFCVFLSDVGLLDELHEFIVDNGLYTLKAMADDSSNTDEKRGNAKILLNIYEAEMVSAFERNGGPSLEVDNKLLSFAQYEDASILSNYIEKNKDVIFDAEQSPRTLTYLTYAINKVARAEWGHGLLKLVLEYFDNFKKIIPVRKAYITKLIAMKLLSNKDVVAFPKIGYTQFQNLLGVVVAQKNKYNGAALLYNRILSIVRADLKGPEVIKQLGRSSLPKVAVCISGMHRCGNLAMESVYENVIEPLNADVFFHSWTEMQDWPGLGGAGDEWILRIFNKDILDKCPVSLRSKKYFKEKFPRTFELLDTPSQSRLGPERLSTRISFKNIQLEDGDTVFHENNVEAAKFLSMGSLNQAKMLYGIYKAHELAVDFERENGFRYDYIVRCRPDVGLRNKMSFSMLDELKSHQIAMEFNKGYGPQDQFWYGQRAAALSMASLWAASVESGALSPFPDFPQMRAHGLILGWMVHSRLEPAHTVVRRDMKMATANAVPPDFSTALSEDFVKDAHDLSENQQVLNFFDVLLKFNKK